jgi:NitT/TauT family transport system permease protein
MKRLINLRPERAVRIALGALPFVLLIGLYFINSELRLAANPNDKLLPALPQFLDAIERLAFTANVRSGHYDFWFDTLASLNRLAFGVGISALLGLCIGVASGVIPYLRAGASPVATAISMVPPMAVLPILFIVFGLGEVAKVVLIVFGIAPVIIRDMQLRAMEIPQELTIKAQTLGASTWQYIVRVVLPQVMPRLITCIRLALGPAWLFVIAAEAVAATEGLGYRIFLVRRYLAMDVILPYVLWITLLALAMDYLLRWLQTRLYPWAESEQEARPAP